MADRIDGLGYSMLALMDGNSGALGGMALANKRAVESSGESRAARLDPGLLAAMAEASGQGGLSVRAIEFGGVCGRLELIAARDEEHHVEMFEFMGRLRAAAIRWANWAGADDALAGQACDGFAMSACALIEGLCEGFEGLAMAAVTSNGYDEASCRQRGENWPPLLDGGDPLMVGDMGGDWRYAWSRTWGGDAPNAIILQEMMAAKAEASAIGEHVPQSKNVPQHGAPRI